jgi:DNA-binding SARP family transcriptional activator
MRLSLRLLGDFQAELGGPVRLRTRKTQALLAYLAVPPGQSHSRDKLATLLWGDRSQSQARSRFRETLFALRRALAEADPPCLTRIGEAIALDAKSVDVDAGALERLAKAGDVESLAKAARLYRGDFLQGLAFRGTQFEDWLMAERERLRELALEILAKLVAQQRAAGAAEEALQTALRLLALDPLQEPVHRSLMHLYCDVGRRVSALQQYQECVRVLQRELGIEPEDETRQLYQEILSGRLVAQSPDASGSARPSTILRRPTVAAAIDAPLIGRSTEMTQLRDALPRAQGREGRMISLVGDAGIGKTRLVTELAAEAYAADLAVLVGRCHESEQILPFAPWLDVLKTARELADQAWLAGLPSTMRRELGRLLPDLSPPDGDERRAPDYLVLFEAVSTLLAHVAEGQPTMLVLEDLHWSDEMSLRLLAFVGRRLLRWHVLLVVTARAEELENAPLLQTTLAELDREPHVGTIDLRALSRTDTAHLVRALAPAGSDDVAVGGLSEQVWRASGGNPLVVVEAMRATAHEGLSTDLNAVVVPGRIGDIIRRQLGRLDEASRDLVALESVVGRDADFRLLHQASGLGEDAVARGLETLIRRRVLHNVGDRLDFTHDRVREVAYREILPPLRKALHRRVADAIVTLHANNLTSFHLSIGLHYFEGEAWDKAVFHLRRAGASALERYAKRDAVACFERALEALARMPRDRSAMEHGFDLRMEMRPALNQLGEIGQVLKYLGEAEALAEQLDDDRRRARVAAFMTVAQTLLGHLDEALASGTRAREIALQLGDLKLRLVATDILAQALEYRGEYERVIELATDNLAVLPAEWVNESFGRFAPTSIYDRVFLVRSLAELGRFDEAQRYADQAIWLAEPRQHAYSLGLSHWAASVAHLLRGDWSQVRSRVEQAIAAFQTADAILSLPSAVAHAAWALARLGELSDARDRLVEAERLVEGLTSRDIVGTAASPYHALGHTCLLLDRLDDAQTLAQKAVESSQRQPGRVAYALHLLGDITSHADRFDAERADAYYQEALALAESRGMRPLIAHGHLGLGRLHRRLRHHGRSHEHLAVAASLYRDMRMSFWLDQAESELVR